MASQTLLRAWATQMTDGSDGTSGSAAAADLPSTTMTPRTAAGERALRRRRARVGADRGPRSGVLPSVNFTAAVVTADRGDEVTDRVFRIGRWGRLASTVCVLGAVVIVSIVLLSAGTSPVIGSVTVTQGDSLWAIAQRVEPDADPQSVIAQIRQLNGLSGDAVAVGAVLRVPIASR